MSSAALLDGEHKRLRSFLDEAGIGSDEWLKLAKHMEALAQRRPCKDAFINQWNAFKMLYGVQGEPASYATIRQHLGCPSSRIYRHISLCIKNLKHLHECLRRKEKATLLDTPWTLFVSMPAQVTFEITRREIVTFRDAAALSREEFRRIPHMEDHTIEMFDFEFAILETSFRQ